MARVRELHDEAMGLAQLAVVARHQGELERAAALSRKAYELEASAADAVPYKEESEPTRSILYRSAASLAYQCQELGAARRMVAQGLAGYPPPDVQIELEDLFSRIRFDQHLQQRSTVLAERDLEVTMQGSAVGPGVIPYNEFLDRIAQTWSLLDRTVQRLMLRKYQRRGRVARAFRPFTPALEAPRAGSFSITLKLLQQEGQLPLGLDAGRVIDEVLTGVELINQAAEQRRKEQISDEAYRRHFVVMTREIAPDGERINLVGLSSKGRAVSLIRQHDEIIPAPAPEEEQKGEGERRPIQITGQLDYATQRGEEIIGLTTEQGKQFDVVVEEGMDDLVRLAFGRVVEVRGTFDGKVVYPSDIVTMND